LYSQDLEVIENLPFVYLLQSFDRLGFHNHFSLHSADGRLTRGTERYHLTPLKILWV
jgi:hypothetical protein